MYEKILEKLKEIREYEWNSTDIKICGEFHNQGSLLQEGVREGETALEAIARIINNLIEEEKLKT